VDIFVNVPMDQLATFVSRRVAYVISIHVSMENVRTPLKLVTFANVIPDTLEKIVK
jgi:hypothetical protein